MEIRVCSPRLNVRPPPLPLPLSVYFYKTSLAFLLSTGTVLHSDAQSAVECVMVQCMNC